MNIQLPPNITFEKKRLSYGWAYVFRHTDLGKLGRIVLQEHSDGKTQTTCEVSGDANDPMTEKRAAIFKPLGLKIVKEMERILSKEKVHHEPAPPPVLPPEPKKGIASKLMQCEKCDAGIGLLILAPDAKDVGELEDYARLMFPEINRHKLPTWIIGALSLSAGVDVANEPRCIIKKFYPAREPIFYASPDEFNAITEKLRDKHC